MFNVFVFKRWTAFLLASMLPVVSFYVMLVFYKSMLYAIGVMLLVMILCAVMGQLLLMNPYTQILEGKGILALDMNSTGVIRPFVVRVSLPFIKGKVDGVAVSDTFDRDAVYNMASPITTGRTEVIDNEKTKKKEFHIILDEKEYNAARFQHFHMPTFIYNSALKTMLTKDFFSAVEKDTFINHVLLYLNRIIEELNGLMRDFGRYIVELTKPKTDFLKNKWVWIIVIGIVIVLLAFFAPSIIDAIKGGASKTVASTAGSGQAITPRA